jgi:SseB protein N-terminal domain
VENNEIDYPENIQLGVEIADAAETNEASKAEELIRANEFIVLQQIDLETGEIEVDEEDNFSVVLAEVDEDMAVVCFTSLTAAESFMDEVCEELTGGTRLPAVVLEGNQLLDGLPEGIGLLINPTTEQECYFPPSCFEFDDHFTDDEDDDEEFEEETDSLPTRDKSED